MAIDFSPLQWRNKWEVLGNILHCPPPLAKCLDPPHDAAPASRMSGSATAGNNKHAPDRKYETKQGSLELIGLESWKLNAIKYWRATNIY